MGWTGLWHVIGCRGDAIDPEGLGVGVGVISDREVSPGAYGDGGASQAIPASVPVSRPEIPIPGVIVIEDIAVSERSRRVDPARDG